MGNGRVVPGGVVEAAGNGGGVAVGGTVAIVETVPKLGQWDDRSDGGMKCVRVGGGIGAKERITYSVKVAL